MVRVFGNALGTFLGLAVVAVAAMAAGAQLGGGPMAIRVAAVLAVLALGAAARLSVATGGLAMADFLLRTHGVMTPVERDQRMDAARGRLNGVVLALSILAAAGGGWLALRGAPYDPLVAVLLGACLITRFRLFRGTAAAVCALAPGAAVLAVGAVNLVVRPLSVPRQMWVVLALAAVCGIVVALAGPRAARAERGRGWVLQWAESTAVLALVCMVFAAFAPWTVFTHTAT